MPQHWLPVAQQMRSEGARLAEIAAKVDRSTAAVSKALRGIRPPAVSKKPFVRGTYSESRRRAMLRHAIRLVAEAVGCSADDLYRDCGCERISQSKLYDQRKNTETK